MELDLRTILVVSNVVAVVPGIALTFIARPLRDHRYLSIISAGYLGHALGVILIAERGSIADFFSIIIGNLLLLLWAVSLWFGARLLRDEPPPWKGSVLFIAAFLLAMAYYLYIDFDTAARIAVLSGTMTLLLCCVCWDLFVVRSAVRQRLGAGGVEYLFTIVMLGIHVAAQAARFLMAMSLSVSPDFMRISTVQQLPILVIVATLIGIAFGLLWIWQRKLEYALAEEKRKAVAASQAKSEFISMVSHDIRTPLNVVLGSLQLLEQERLEMPQQQTINTAKAAGDVLLSLVDHVLDIERIENRTVEFSKASFSVRELVSELDKIFAQLAAEKGIGFSSRIDPAMPEYVLTDRARLIQVLSNIIGNAVKFTQSGSVELTVSLSQREGVARLAFSVMDTGIGMEAAQLDKIFAKFHKGESEAKIKDGFGLGLAIARTIVEAMGGEIRVHSAVGQGSRFDITLPLETPADAMPPAAGNTQAPLCGLKILVAEDNKANRYIAGGILESIGHHVEFAYNGQQATELADTSDWDLILMDLNMPEMNGQDAMLAIRAGQGHKADIPILALTAEVSPRKLNEALTAGFNGYITKPIRKDSLAEAVDRAYQSVPRALLDTTILAEHLSVLGQERFTMGIEICLSDIETQLSKLSAAMESKDFPSLAACAHKLRGGAGSWGLADCARKASSLERAADNNALDAAKYYASCIESALPRIRQQLSSTDQTQEICRARLQH